MSKQRIIVYGIKNCNTMKKAFSWLKEYEVDYQFYDFKKEGLSIEKAESWIQSVGLPVLVNKRWMTWRKMEVSLRNKIEEGQDGSEIFHESPTLIKRPIIEKDGKVIIVGFDEEKYKALFL